MLFVIFSNKHIVQSLNFILFFLLYNHNDKYCKYQKKIFVHKKVMKALILTT